MSILNQYEIGFMAICISICRLKSSLVIRSKFVKG